jgi:hypothetical protein
LDGRFSESSTTLLLGMACLDPSSSFANFQKDKVLAMAQLYSQLYSDDFESKSKMVELCLQLDNFLEILHDHSRLSNLKGLVIFAEN